MIKIMNQTQEVRELQKDINEISNKLLTLGEDLLNLSVEQYNLKEETYLHKLIQQEDIRNKQRGGCLILHEGKEGLEEKLKLTDTLRDSLAEYGLKAKFARYEANKRKIDILKLAVDAMKSALMGKQSSLNIAKLEFQLDA